MVFKQIIEEIDKTQRATLVSLTDFRSKGKGTDILPSQSRGLYWLWCKTPLDAISKIDDGEGAHVPVNKLLRERNGFNYVCKVKEGDFQVLYNGMGGYAKWRKGSTYGLRGRINQEINCTNTKTGTLNLMGRNFNLEDWKVSFFDFEDPNNKPILQMLPMATNEFDPGEYYKEYANTLETLWRMHYGTPVFCRY